MSTSDLFDLTDDQLRARASLKWAAAGEDVLPAWVAEMDVKAPPAVLQRLQQALDAHDLGYPGRPDGVCSAFAGFAARRWGWDIDEQLISVHVDIATAGTALMRGLGGLEGGVVVMPPVYNGFAEWLHNGQLTPVDVPLLDVGDPERDARMDLPGIEAALAGGARVILLCSPHNPLGRVFSAEELAELATLARRHGAVVISDEIHAPLTHPGVQFTPWLSVSEDARAVGVALHAATKPWNFAGLKAGLVVRSAEGPWPESLNPARTMIESGHWGVLASEAAYRDSVDWLDEVAAHVQDQTQRLPELLAQHLPGARFRPGQASYLAWVDLSGVPMPGRGETEDAGPYFRRTAQVFLSGGRDFGGEVARDCVRINLGTSAERLERIITRMGQAVRG